MWLEQIHKWWWHERYEKVGRTRVALGDFAAEKFRFQNLLVYCLVSKFSPKLDFIFLATLPPISRLILSPSELVPLLSQCGGGIALSLLFSYPSDCFVYAPSWSSPQLTPYVLLCPSMTLHYLLSLDTLSGWPLLNHGFIITCSPIQPWQNLQDSWTPIGKCPVFLMSPFSISPCP